MAAGGSSSKSCTIAEEKKNFLRFVSLTTDLGTDAVRICFDKLVPPATLSSHLKHHENYLRSLKNVLRPVQLDTLYPATSVTKSSDFDITILVCLIRNTTQGTTPNKGWGNELPDVIDISAGDDVARIKYYRNYLAHKSLPEMSAVDFNHASRTVIEVSKENTSFFSFCFLMIFSFVKS